MRPTWNAEICFFSLKRPWTIPLMTSPPGILQSNNSSVLKDAACAVACLLLAITFTLRADLPWCKKGDIIILALGHSVIWCYLYCNLQLSIEFECLLGLWGPELLIVQCIESLSISLGITVWIILCVLLNIISFPALCSPWASVVSWIHFYRIIVF